jgi:sulfatase modifying factor 1
MDQTDNNRGRKRPDLDATTPNFPFQQRQEGARAAQPEAQAQRNGKSDLDFTSPNLRLAVDEPKEERVSKPAAANFDLTEMRIRTADVYDENEIQQSSTISHQEERPRDEKLDKKTRSVPLWIWIAGGGVTLLLVAAVVLLVVLLPRNAAFTLKVLEAPAGSRVFVDGVASGVPQADGVIVVHGLKPDATREVVVKHADFEAWSTSVKGEAGQETVITAKLAPRVTAPAKPANEIDYRGPMVFVAAGVFVMGDNKHLPDEKPEHEVTVPDYYIDKFEVTNEQYKKFCDETKRAYPPDPWWNTDYFNTQPQSPVVGVSWDDAAAYATWAGKRLPSEAEWEKAASWGPDAQKKRQWPWGDSPETNRASLGLKPAALKLSAVTENADGASAYGAQGMSGNAAEWVDAFYKPYGGNAIANPEYGDKNRVVRGGTSVSGFDDARTTRRFARAPDYTAEEKAANAYLIGFRCVVSADDPKLQDHLKKK